MKISRKFFVVELDYSVASLDKFEDLFAQWHYALPGGSKPENVDKLVRVWGAYLGEMIRRTLGGEWVTLPGERTALRLRSGDIFPHDAIRRRLAKESSETLPAYYVALANP